MKFHPLYAGRFAMGLTNLGPEAPGIIATQSTHKQLAGFSQSSQIHTKDRHIRGQKRRVEHRRFNESFMQYASTSPFYPLFASLDVGAQMMKGRSGVALWDDTVRLGIELRKKIRTVRREFEEKEARAENRWFFEPFVPERVKIPDVSRAGGVHDVAWEAIGTDELASNPAHWQLAPDATWHGFPQLAEGFAMTDPNKLTLLTPGFDRANDGYAEHGIPAPVVAQYLRENRIVPEKNDLNSQQGRYADQRTSCVQEAARRKRAARGGHPRILPAAAGALCRRAVAGPVRADASLLPRGGCQRAAGKAVFARALAGDRNVAARGLAPSCAQRRRISPDRGDCRSHRHNAIRGLSARYRHDRATDASGRLRLHTYVVAE
jgi:hypothetical protein